MKKVIAHSLREKADEVAFNFSRKDRPGNVSGETFRVDSIHPLSESTAYVHFKKNTGKIAVAFFYYINMNGGMWQYFFPTYDHCIGAEKLRDILHDAEQKNFKYNFQSNEWNEQPSTYQTMDIPDNGYEYRENADLARKAVKRLSVTKLSIEYLFHRDEYDRDELRFTTAIEESWPIFSTSQKKVLYMHLVQGFSFTSIADLQGYTPQNASQLFKKACGIIQNNI